MFVVTLEPDWDPWYRYYRYAERTGKYPVSQKDEFLEEAKENADIWKRLFDCDITYDEEGYWKEVIFVNEEHYLAFMLQAEGWK